MENVIYGNGSMNALRTLMMANAYIGGSHYNDIELPRVKQVRHVPQYDRKKEQPRNEKCNCGSGKKYKKCCGV